jgi:hypothetical protein
MLLEAVRYQFDWYMHYTVKKLPPREQDHVTLVCRNLNISKTRFEVCFSGAWCLIKTNKVVTVFGGDGARRNYAAPMLAS